MKTISQLSSMIALSTLAMNCATAFNKLFITRPSTQDRSSRQTVRLLHGLRGSPLSHSPLLEVLAAIKGSKSSKTVGPDGLAPIMLKNLETCALEFLSCVINISLASCVLPAKWKVGRVIPLLKHGKPADKAESYRPIALLSPVAKVLEKLILPHLVDHLPVAAHQHGFRKNHSTTTALSCITHEIAKGMNEPKPCSKTVLVALDLSLRI